MYIDIVILKYSAKSDIFNHHIQLLLFIFSRYLLFFIVQIFDVESIFMRTPIKFKRYEIFPFYAL